MTLVATIRLARIVHHLSILYKTDTSYVLQRLDKDKNEIPSRTQLR